MWDLFRGSLARAQKTATRCDPGSRDSFEGRLRQREDEHAIAALGVDLVVPARSDRAILLAADHIGHRGCVDTGAAVVLPQLLAGLGVERLEPPVGLAVEHEIARGG